MTMRIEAGDVTRGDLFLIDPAEIAVILPANGRQDLPTEQEIRDLADSIKEHGQSQPVLCRRLGDKRVQLVFGYRRHAAVTLLNAEGTATKLKCLVSDMNETEAFVANIIENKDRKGTQPIDDAHNQRRLRDDHGWSNDQIAALYKCSVSAVVKLTKLLRVAAPIQAKVAKGTMTASAALDVADLPEVQQHEVVSESTDAQGVTSSEKVRKAVRKRGTRKARSLAELRAHLERTAKTNTDERVSSLVGDLMAFIDGGITEEAMDAAWNEAVMVS